MPTAQKLACIDDFISRLPSRYNMKIGNSGIELSQGQKQRILIARAIYKNPQLLVFDGPLPRWIQSTNAE